MSALSIKILFGPPGSGKTFSIESNASLYDRDDVLICNSDFQAYRDFTKAKVCTLNSKFSKSEIPNVPEDISTVIFDDSDHFDLTSLATVFKSKNNKVSNLVFITGGSYCQNEELLRGIMGLICDQEKNMNRVDISIENKVFENAKRSIS